MEDHPGILVPLLWTSSLRMMMVVVGMGGREIELATSKNVTCCKQMLINTNLLSLFGDYRFTVK